MDARAAPLPQTRRRGLRLAALAAAALLLGTAVYLLDRGPVYFLPQAAQAPTGAFGAIGGWLPALVHAYALSLLTALALPAFRGAAALACGLWWLIDSLFELGQQPQLAPRIAAAIPRAFDGLPFLENARNYFLLGTFDPADLAAIACGAAAAFATLWAATLPRTTA